MQLIENVILALLVLLVIGVFILISKTKKLSSENKKLKEILAIKDTTIANYEASRASVNDVIENFSSLDDVMALINAGESKISVSEKLDIPVKKIELIMKIDKIKKGD